MTGSIKEKKGKERLGKYGHMFQSLCEVNRLSPSKEEENRLCVAAQGNDVIKAECRERDQL
jgi:hypothetical protein